MYAPTNDVDERLATFCNKNDLVIGGALFKHRDIRTITWTSRNDRNQIDHVNISVRYRDSLMDTRAMRGADANPDHHMVMGKFRLKLCSTKSKMQERTKRLRDSCFKVVFRLEVSNRGQVLETNDTDDIEKRRERFEEVYNKSAKGCWERRGE